MTLNYKFGIFLLLIFTSCDQVQNLSDTITKPSARVLFERDLKNNDSIYSRYLHSYAKSKQNALQLELPAVVTSYAHTLDFSILAYTIELKTGERFKIASPVHADSLQLSIDVFTFENDSVVSKSPMISNEPKTNRLEFNVSESTKYKVVILPHHKMSSYYALKLFTEPTLEFPVSGKANKDIQSFWGASRGGGKRSHKGIDIFAERGTPVIAATNGYISNTGNRGLGGKQVWLRDGVFGHSLYYAHLDSIAVSGSNRVKIGDTLGFVGNTGNARTTSPHLHFGIYTKNGAVDPLPFVKKTASIAIAETTFYPKGITRLKRNELRIGATVMNEKIQDLELGTPVKILSKTQRWFHLKIHDSIEGFMHESLLKQTP